MSCDEIQNRLNAYRDAELDPETQTDIEEHLDECPDCRQELERIETVCCQLERAAPAPEVPEGFAERVVERATEESASAEPPRSGAWGDGWPGATGSMRVAAAAVLALGIAAGALMATGLWSGDGSRTDRPSPRTATVTTYGVDQLSAAPEGSLTDAYVAISDPPSVRAD